MSEKMTCPGCNSHSSTILHAFGQGAPCPVCGLSASASAEILDVRRARADERLKADAEAALLRADRAESELRTARYRLQRVAEAVKEALAEDVPDWWEPS